MRRRQRRRESAASNSNSPKAYRRESCLATAQFNLGSMYELGDGVPQNNTRAYEWYSVSANQGSELAEMYRDMVYEELSPADREQAQQML